LSTIRPELKEKLGQLKAVGDAISEYVHFELFDPESLAAEQVGYAVDAEGRSLVSGDEGARASFHRWGSPAPDWMPGFKRWRTGTLIRIWTPGTCCWIPLTVLRKRKKPR